MKASTVTIPVKKNHMEIHWHDYADKENPVPIAKASLDARASVIGRVGIMMLACGTGAWRVRSSMNELSELMNITCTVDIGLMSFNYTCFDGDNSFTQSLCLTNTGVNTSQLNRLEKFVIHFQEKELLLSCDEIHSALDEIERIHSLYSPTRAHRSFLPSPGCSGIYRCLYRRYPRFHIKRTVRISAYIHHSPFDRYYGSGLISVQGLLQSGRYEPDRCRLMACFRTACYSCIAIRSDLCPYYHR